MCLGTIKRFQMLKNVFWDLQRIFPWTFAAIKGFETFFCQCHPDFSDFFQILPDFRITFSWTSRGFLIFLGNFPRIFTAFQIFYFYFSATIRVITILVLFKQKNLFLNFPRDIGSLQTSQEFCCDHQKL